MAKRVLIVGAGIVGLSTALWAAREGLDVTLVDEGAPDGDGCSYGNAGMIVPSHFIPLAAPGMVARGLKWMWNPESPFYIRPRLDRDLLTWGLRFVCSANAGHVASSAPLLSALHRASRAIFEEWADEWGDAFGLTRRGLLMLCRTEHGFREEAGVAARARAMDIPAEILGAGEVAALEPGLRLDVAGAVRYPMDCHLTPSRLMAALRDAVERAGVTLSWRTPVTGFVVTRGNVAAARAGGAEVQADEFVLCAGVWSTGLARGLGLRLPMEAGKGLSMTLEAPRRLPVHCALLSEAHVAVTPMGGTLRVGGTMELAGLDRSVTPARVRGIVRAMTRYLPDFTYADFAGVPVWSGLRPCSPDGLPYLGRLARFTNVSVATGHAMMGVSLGPITGRLMADVLCRRTPSLDIAALSPNRYA